MDIILGKVICLVVDQVNTYISLVFGDWRWPVPFFVCMGIAVLFYYLKK